MVFENSLDIDVQEYTMNLHMTFGLWGLMAKQVMMGMKKIMKMISTTLRIGSKR
jgi:hypothetical protein